MRLPRFVSPGPGGTRAQWAIVGLLSVIAAGIWLRPAEPTLPAAWGQSAQLAGARGIFAFSGPMARDQYGLFMLDVDQGTIWCYAFENVGGTNKLRLVAARTWLYDRYLQDFNCAAPDFRMVQKLVAEQRVQTAAPAEGSSPPAAADGATDGMKTRREP